MRHNIYSIKWDSAALKKFNNIQDQKLKGHIIDALELAISHNPLIGKLLTGPLKGVRSYRIGIIRILYKPYENFLLIMVLDIAYRRDVYKF